MKQVPPGVKHIILANMNTILANRNGGCNLRK